MFACAALVACTNDDIVENNGNNPQGEDLENVPAYITVSVGTNSTSSRAEVNGDEDGNSENSGHENDGVDAEVKVNDLAVIIKSLDASGNNAPNSGVVSVVSKDNFTPVTVGKETIYTVTDKFKVLAGKHKVLVIVNPVAAIKTKIKDIAGDYVEIGNLYDELTSIGGENKAFDVKLGTLSKYSAGLGDVSNTTSEAESFMMANRTEVEVEATSANSQNSPKVATVDLERVVAKIAYRSVKEDDKYPIKVKLTKWAFQVVESDGTKYALVKDAADRIRARKISAVTGDAITKDMPVVTGVTYYENVTYAATDAEKGEFECYTYDNNKIGSKLSPIELKGQITAIPEDKYYLTKNKLEDGTETWNAPTPIFEAYYNELTDWSVQLKKYALVNLVKDAYVVRHIANQTGTSVNAFGLLTGDNYIADPFFAAKNSAAVDYNFADYGSWSTIEKESDRTEAEKAWWATWNVQAKEWFNNTLKEVADETAGTWKGASYFRELIGTTNKDDNGSGHITGTGENQTTINNPGVTLEYCFGNGVLSAMQKHGLTTGIVFKALITKSNAETNVETMYQYNKGVYNDLNDIIKAYGPGNKEIAALKDLTGEKEVKDAAIRKAGIKIYQENECYYYTNQIKHFDNGDNNVAGNMEFAIVRNNIYSLAVTNIKSIGDAAIDPNPDTDDESAVGYIQIDAKILPWIVRYNNIEF